MSLSPRPPRAAVRPDPRPIALALAALAWLAVAGAAFAAPPLMLARPWHPGVLLADYWVSEKYDGVRGHWDGQRLLTRNGRPIAAPAWFTAGWPAVPLDGELWAGRGRFEAAQSAVAAATPDDAAWRSLRYMVFDLPAHPGTFIERLAVLPAAVAATGAAWVQPVAQVKVADEAALQALLKRTVADGGEGLMLHRGASLYRDGRSDDLLKLKSFDDAEAVVVAHLPGRGRHAGRMGALLLETPEGLRFRLGAGFSDADRDQPPPVGSHVTYRYAGLHESGLPRFARFLRVRSVE